MLYPRRHINEAGKGQRMAFGKAVTAEALNLMKTALGKVAFVTAPDHATNHHLLEMLHAANIAKGGHCGNL